MEMFSQSYYFLVFYSLGVNIDIFIEKSCCLLDIGEKKDKILEKMDLNY